VKSRFLASQRARDEPQATHGVRKGFVGKEKSVSVRFVADFVLPAT
jgi:hypothetical protein